jgi:hypothetical protein
MTDYATMDAGPEMDLLIHEKVMGLSITELPGLTPGVIRLEAGAVNLVGPWRPDAARYSSDIAHAWEVVERLKDDCNISIKNDQGEVVEWYVEIQRLKPAYSEHSAGAETAPLAICRAALLSMP